MLNISNDPFKLVLIACDYIWPELKANIQWNPKLKMRKKEYGCTFFPDNGEIPTIELNPELKVKDAIEILAHELAHVKTGIGKGHNSDWSDMFHKIHEQYEKLI